MLLKEINKTLGLDDDWNNKFNDDLEIEYKLFRLEKLVERRPLLLK